ncbi:MAG: CinA family protein [Nitrospirae bacterium]|nr:CinA family protein [Nitrospirota bacterium]
MENDLIITAEKLLLLLSEKGLTLSVAESCTGGLISHAITSIPGASKVFHSGIVAYSIDSKLRLLGIDENVINASGMISGETAKAMAENIRIKIGTDISLSVTGNLGPDALEGKGVGLVYFAVSCSGGVVLEERFLHGDRHSNKYDAALEGVNLLINVVSKNI